MTEENTKYTLVRRLRTMAAIGWNPIGDEAADEIERLQSKVNILLDAASQAADQIKRCDYTPARSTLLVTINTNKE